MAKNWDAELECDFGGLSVGDSTARLGVKLTRTDISYDAADELLCGRRCAVTILNGLGNGEGQLPGMEKAEITEVQAIADIKGFTVNPKAFGFGLTFVLTGVNPSMLAKFPKRRGRLFIRHESDLDVETASDDSDG